VVSIRTQPFSLSFVHNNNRTGSPDRPFRPLPVLAAVAAQAFPLSLWMHAHASPLRVAPTRARNGGRKPSSELTPAKRHRAVSYPGEPPPPLVCTRSRPFDLQWTSLIAYPFVFMKLVHHGPMHRVHSAVHHLVSRWIGDLQLRSCPAIGSNQAYRSAPSDFV
jgi:hypothetical protein